MTCSILDAAIKTSDTSFILEPVREGQFRPNKLSRSRAPLNQQKSIKDSTYNKSTLDVPPLNLIECEECDNDAVNTNLSLIPTHDEIPLNRMDTKKSTPDGNIKVLAVQSAITSFSSNVSNFEPELVLSPAKLGH